MSHVILSLDVNGNPVAPTGEPISARAVPSFLNRHLTVPESATDIVVFVHGWRNTPATALRRADRFMGLVDAVYRDQRHRYPALHVWRCHYVIVCWPSASNPFLAGYRRIRDRAHQMTTRGQATTVLAQLLGYLNVRRERGSGTLRTRGGQFLHLVGHSFGCRFLAEAVQWAADRPHVLSWNRADPRYPYAADTLLMFQMAAPHDTLLDQFPRLVADSPIAGPIVLTHATGDRAVGMWHTLAEGVPGVGFRGVPASPEVSSTALRPAEEDYSHHDFSGTVVNVDASWRFRRGRLHPAGSHADIFHPESAHLLLSLANLAR